MRKTRKKIEIEKHALRNLASSLILYENIKTTESKAKSLKPIVERMITKAKNGSLADKRFIFSYLPQKGAAKKTIEELSKRYKDRPGGYTRIVKLGQRRSDAAKIAEISLIEGLKNEKRK